MGHWGWLIIIYLFLGGLGAGAYLTSFAAEKGWLGQDTRLKHAGYYLAAPCVAVGSLILVADLGISYTEIWKIFAMFSNINSVMSWGIYILTFFIVVGIICIYYTWKGLKIPTVWSYFGAILALGTGIYTGVLLSVVNAVPFWNTFLMPVLFVVSALSTGLAATSLLSHFTEKSQANEEVNANKTHLVLVLLEIILVVLLLAFAAAGINGRVAADSVSSILTGTLALPFWLLLIVIGLIIPLIYYYTKTSTKNLTKTDGDKLFATISDIAILIGGLTLRAVVIFSALPIWYRITG